MGKTDNVNWRCRYVNLSWMQIRTIWGEGMKICENGTIRDMTTEEVAEFEKLAAEMEAMPAPEPTAEERIAALEQDNAKLREALDALNRGQ